MLKRIAPALALLLLSPIIAEYLLGDFSVRQMAFLPFFIPQYGGGAILVRELSRRANRGWPTILGLALAYALAEEGFTTQSLFNPTYAGRRLLDYGYIPALGTSLNWAVFVLTLHMVWSVGSAIAVAEGLAGRRWRSAWFGPWGLMVTAVVFLIGCGFTTAMTLQASPFIASPAQFAAVGALVIIVATAAFVAHASELPVSRSVPSLWVIGAWCLALSSAFHVAYGHGGGHGVSAGVSLAIMLVLEALATTSLWSWSRSLEWTPRHSLAAATGAILTYGWVGLDRMIRGGATALGIPATITDDVGQGLLLAGVVVLVLVGMRRLAVSATDAQVTPLRLKSSRRE